MVARMDQPGRWAGGFRAWDEHGAYLATARGRTPGRLLRIPSTALRERSAEWFPFAGHLIEGLYRTGRAIEATARQRSALVTLGTLAAGLAHEINNPAAAATRAVDALTSTFGDRARRSSPPWPAATISPDQFAALEELRGELRPVPDDPDPLARADQEQELADWLGGQDVDDAWTLAGPLAAAGVDVAWCRRAAAELDGPALAPALDWVAASGPGPDPADGGEGLRTPDLRARRRRPVLLPDGPLLDAADRHRRRAGQHVGDARPPAAGRGQRGPGLRRRRADHPGVRGRAEPGLDQPDRQRDRRHGRPRHAADSRPSWTASTWWSGSPTPGRA